MRGAPPQIITPRMAIELARIAEAAGVPPGIISVLPGKGSIVGDALVKHPLIRRIAFTGGTNVGMGIQRLAAEKLMPTSACFSAATTAFAASARRGFCPA